MSTYLVTGGCGFIGANFIHYILDKEKDSKVINLDKLTYAGNEKYNADLDYSRYKLIIGDIKDSKLVREILVKNNIDAIINFAAESHVDNSIDNPIPFFETNIMGLSQLLNTAKDVWQGNIDKKFIHISTDEVYGEILSGRANENSPLNPTSPYASSKTCGDLIVSSYVTTYNFPAIITRCTNNYGRFQHTEKMLPKLITNAINNKDITIYGDGSNSRDWLNVLDHCEAIYLVLKKGKIGKIYNIGIGEPLDNNTIANMALGYIKEKIPTTSKIIYVKDRAVNDKRYALDSTKIHNELGWSPKVDLETGLKDTIDWYIKNINILK